MAERVFSLLNACSDKRKFPLEDCIQNITKDKVRFIAIVVLKFTKKDLSHFDLEN